MSTNLRKKAFLFGFPGIGYVRGSNRRVLVKTSNPSLQQRFRRKYCSDTNRAHICYHDQDKPQKAYLNQLNNVHSLVDSSSHCLENNFIRSFLLYYKKKKTNPFSRKQDMFIDRRIIVITKPNHR